MVYKKSALWGKENARGSILQYAGMILLYTFFLCGLLLGCALFHAGGFVQNIGADAAEAMRSNSAGWFACNAGLRIICIVALFVFCSLSCLGAAPLCALAAFTGGRFGVLASALIAEYGMKGLCLFSVLYLPGGILLVFAEILLFAFGLEVSKKAAACVFAAGDAQIRVVDYLKNTTIPILLMLASMLTDFLMRILFAGMLLSGV